MKKRGNEILIRPTSLWPVWFVCPHLRHSERKTYNALYGQQKQGLIVFLPLFINPHTVQYSCDTVN